MKKKTLGGGSLKDLRPAGPTPELGKEEGKKVCRVGRKKKECEGRRQKTTRGVAHAPGTFGGGIQKGNRPKEKKIGCGRGGWGEGEVIKD